MLYSNISLPCFVRNTHLPVASLLTPQDEVNFNKYKKITEGMVNRGEAPGVAGASGVTRVG